VFQVTSGPEPDPNLNPEPQVTVLDLFRTWKDKALGAMPGQWFDQYPPMVVRIYCNPMIPLIWSYA